MINRDHRQLMGAYIRQQRKLADLSMRQVSAMVGISNPYLSQIERGLRAPSEAVAAGIATALGVGVEDLYEPGGPRADAGGTTDLLQAIDSARELTSTQRASLAEVYRSFVRANMGSTTRDDTPRGSDTGEGTGPDDG